MQKNKRAAATPATPKNNVVSFPSAFAPAKNDAEYDYEDLDLNEYVTGGKEGLTAYRVSGGSTVSAIKTGYLVFVEPEREPRAGDIVLSRIGGFNYIDSFQTTLRMNQPDLFGVIVAHVAVYRDTEVPE